MSEHPAIELIARGMAYVRDGHDSQWRDYRKSARLLLAGRFDAPVVLPPSSEEPRLSQSESTLRSRQ